MFGITVKMMWSFMRQIRGTKKPTSRNGSPVILWLGIEENGWKFVRGTVIFLTDL
jgi:hypothetical protein